MAITYVDSGHDGGHDAAPTTAFTLDLSGLAVQEGDLFVIQATTDRDASYTVTLPGTGTNTTVLGVDTYSGTNTCAYSVYLWRAPASPPSSITFTFSVSTEGALSWARFRGVDVTTPLDVAAGALITWPNATSYTAPAITTVTAGAYVLGGANIPSASRTFTATGWTARVHAPDRLGALLTKGVQASAGTTGTVAMVQSGATLRGAAWQVALRPASTTSITGTAAQTLPALTQAASGSFTGTGVTGTVTSTLPALTQSAAGSSSAPSAPTPTLMHSFVGLGTSTSLAVTVKTTNAISARLKVATDTALTTGVVYGGAVTPDASGYAALTATGLSAATTYYYGVELTDALSATTTTAYQGDPKTLPAPGAPASFTMAHASCLASGSTSTTAMANALARNPDLFLHLGDWHYADSTSTSQATHRGYLEAPITGNSSLRNLIKSTPTLYITSDHDAGPNGALPGAWTAANLAAYKQVTPHTSQVSDAIYDSIVIGRVRIIWTDDRHLRTSDGSTGYMDATQYAWFQGQMQASEPVKLWVQQGPWNGPNGTTDTTGSPTIAGNDKWWNYPTQHAAVASWLAANAVGRIITMHGDAHSLCADDGTNAPGGLATIGAAPLDKTTSIKGGPYSQGVYSNTLGSQQQFYGVTSITDDGTQITVAYTGYDSSNVARITLTDVTETSITGTSGQTLPALSQAATGTAVAPSFTGSVAQSLPALTQAIIGTTSVPAFTATAAQALPALTQSAAGTTAPPSFTGTVTSTLPALTQAASGSTGTPAFTGTITQMLPALTQVAAGDSVPPIGAGTIAQILPALTQAASGTTTAPAFTGTITQTLPALTQVATGQASVPAFTATITGTLPPLTQAAVGAFMVAAITGIIAQVLPALTQAALDDSGFRDLTITITGPTGHPLTITGPAGRARTLTGPTGHPAGVTGPTT